MGEVAGIFGRLLPPLLLIIGALLALRRFARPPVQAGQALRVVARTGLTRSAVVAVVAVGDRRFLLGASEAGVRLLVELDAAATADDMTGGTEPAAPVPWTGLADRLRERTLRAAGEGPRHVTRV